MEKIEKKNNFLNTGSVYFAARRMAAA